MPVVDTENEGDVAQEDFQTRKITYKDFMETWSGMLDAAKIKVLPHPWLFLDSLN